MSLELEDQRGNLPAEEAVADRLAGIRHVALDMDGTIYCGSVLFPFTTSFLKRLDRLGIGYSFLTNNSSKSRRDYIARLEAMGLSVGEDRVHSSTDAALEFLKSRHGVGRKLFVIGTRSMKTEVEEAGFSVVSGDEKPEIVLVAYDTDPAFGELCKAAWWIRKGLPYYATHPDMVCPTDQETVMLDCGAVCEMLRAGSGRAPDEVLGKPAGSMLEGLSQRTGVPIERFAMVGDRLYTDIEMARRTGALGVLVLTGEATLTDVERAEHRPDLVLDSIEVLGDLLEEARNIH
jgi:HAD superfamily hydrolase (TIGR01450 family)